MKVPSVVEVAVQSGAPASIQFRIVSISWEDSWGCPSGIRLAGVGGQESVIQFRGAGVSRNNASFFDECIMFH